MHGSGIHIGARAYSTRPGLALALWSLPVWISVSDGLATDTVTVSVALKRQIVDVSDGNRDAVTAWLR
jgi:hypothetical protein